MLFPSRREPAIALVAAALACLLTAAGTDETPKSQAPPAKEKAAPKEPPNPAAPAVVSKAKTGGQGGGSPFLKPPGDGRYDREAEDWAELPSWRQASFFGVRAKGQFFIYVVDCSGSMIDEGRLTRAKDEVRRSVLRLRDPQRFHVIFYNDQPIMMPGGLSKAAGLASRGQFLAWLRLIEPDGDTDPRGALALAIAQRPDAVFLLSDGLFPEGTVESVARMNRKKVPIHCVDLSGGEAGDQLQRIAKESGGRYASRPGDGSGGE